MYLAHENPAGGAPLVQVVLTALIALTFLAPTALVVVAERTGRANPVGRLADRLGIRIGLPRWVALPSLTLIASLLSAGVGVYWDVPYHVDFGRDEGPLANPAHYLILFGLLGVFSSGVLSCGLATDPLPRRTLRVPWTGRLGWPEWRAPLGGVIVTASGGFGLLGFPLDDLWHRLFGQDVTEWGPTHVLMIGGAVVATLGGAVLVAEARQVGASGAGARALDFHYALWWLLGISAFLMEYDIGVPQYPMVAQVTIVAIASAWPLVWARSAYGPGGAVFAALAFLAARGALMLLADAGLGRSTHHFSLYLAQAVLIELLAVVLPVGRRYLFGVLTGVLAGTLGVVAEWAWTHVFLPLPWPAHQLPVYAGYAVLAGVGGGLIGAWQLSRLDEIADVAATRPGAGAGAAALPRASATGPRHAAPSAGRRRQYASLLVGAVLAFGVLGAAVPRTADETLRGTVTLDRAGPDRAYVTVALNRPDAVEDAVWFYALSWQGGGSVRAPMRPVGDGVYRSTRPMPVTGEWKTLIRVHRSTNHLVALPVYMPADTAIPVKEIPATSGATRVFTEELHLLQREAKVGLPVAMWYAGYATLFLIYLILFTLITALYVRAAGPVAAPRPAAGSAPPPRGAPPAGPKPAPDRPRAEVTT